MRPLWTTVEGCGTPEATTQDCLAPCLTAGWSLRQRDGVARRRRISGGTRHAGTIIVTITVVAIETHSLRPRPDEKILVASAEFERGLYFLWELINTKCLEF
jgi:hypothetical protein